MNYNKTIIMGNLTADPELRHTPKGNAVCNFTVASGRKYRDGGGEMKDETLFIECTAWTSTGENIAKHRKKGDGILVDGFLVADTWTDKETGKSRSKIKLNVTTARFIYKDGAPTGNEDFNE